MQHQAPDVEDVEVDELIPPTSSYRMLAKGAVMKLRHGEGPIFASQSCLAQHRFLNMQ